MKWYQPIGLVLLSPIVLTLLILFSVVALFTLFIFFCHGLVNGNFKDSMTVWWNGCGDYLMEFYEDFTEEDDGW